MPATSPASVAVLLLALGCLMPWTSSQGGVALVLAHAGAAAGISMSSSSSSVHRRDQNVRHRYHQQQKPTQVSPIFQNRRHLQSLEQIWDMSHFEYQVQNDTTTSSLWSVTFDFTSSDRIEDEMARVDLLDPEECAAFLLDNNDVVVEDSTTVTPAEGGADDDDDDATVAILLDDIFTVTGPNSIDPIGQGYGFRNWTSTVSLSLPEGLLDQVSTTTPGTISNETISPVFTLEETGDGSNVVLGVQFCVRIALAMPRGDDDLVSERPVTQVGLLVTVDYNITDTTTTTLSGSMIRDFPFPTFTLPPAPPEARAAFCDVNNVELETQPLIREGDIVRICIFPPEGGDFTLLGVDSFQYQEFEREDDGDSVVDVTDASLPGNSTVTTTGALTTQAAITQGGEPSFNQLTQYQCTPEVCVIQSVLVANFFEPYTAILASGYVTFLDSNAFGNNETDTEQLGSNVYLAFETWLRIVNELQTAVPTMTPSRTPSNIPSYMPSVGPSMAPTSGVSSVPFRFISQAISLATLIFLLA